MTVSLLIFILLWNMAMTTIEPSLQCTEATSSLPGANSKMAVGSSNDNIFLIGGTYSASATKAIISKKSKETDTIWSTDSSSVFVNAVIKGESQWWTQQQDIVYMVTDPYRMDMPPNKGPYISTYDVANEVFTANWNDIILPTKMRGCVASSADYLYFVGGYDSSKRDYMTEDAYFNTVLMFNFASYTFITLPSMKQRRRGHSCIVHNNKLWAIGGKNASSTKHLNNAYHKSIERISIHDIEQNSWAPMKSALNSLTVGASGVRAVGYNQYIFVIGGYYDERLGGRFTVLDTVHIIDTTLDMVRLSPIRLPYAIWGAATIIISDTIYIFGGVTDTSTWSKGTNKWMDCKLSTSQSTTSGPSRKPSSKPTPAPTDATTLKPTATVVPCTTAAKIDYIFAVDASSSIGTEAFQKEKDWLAEVFEDGSILSSDARIGWSVFSTSVDTTNIGLKEWSKDELVDYVKGISYIKGATNTAGALKAILDEYSRNGMDSREKVVIMTTDGKPYLNGEQDVCTPYQSVIKEAGIRVIVLAVGPDITPKYVTCLMKDPATDYIPVTSFDKDDFNIILPQLQEISCPPVAPCTTAAKIDYIFAVDVSSSIGDESFQSEKDWLSEVFRRGDILSSGARIGWSVFSTSVDTTNIGLKEWSKDELVNYVKGISYIKGATNTAGALRAILDEFNKNGMDSREKVVIMTTDGRPYLNGDQDVCTPYSSIIKKAGIRVIVLAVGPDITPKYVTCLMKEPDTDYIPVTSFDKDDFNTILPQLQEISCPPEAPVTPCTSSVEIDYIFAVDASTSIGTEAFQKEKDWLLGVFERGDILSSDARVGWSIFATDVNISDIVLKERRKHELVNYVKGISYTKGATNTAGALKAILDEYNTNGMDSREKVVIMTTDGKPYLNGVQNVCGYKEALKQAGIRIIVLGVGPDITAKYVTCLMVDADTDYIPVTSFNVDDFNTIVPALKTIACPDAADGVLHSARITSDDSHTSDASVVPVYGWILIIVSALLLVGLLVLKILCAKKKSEANTERYVTLLDDDDVQIAEQEEDATL